MNLFFDLDGTLLDIRQRLYHLFCDLAGAVPFTLEQYGQLKQEGWLQKQLLLQYLHFSEEQATAFHDRWLEEVETPAYLRFDQLFPFTKKVLEESKRIAKSLYLVTARRNREHLILQLNQLELTDFFTGILTATPPQEKHTAVLAATVSVAASDCWVGDTTADIKAARLLGMKSIAVYSGQQGEQLLKQLQPDFLLKDISQLPGCLKSSFF
jgi:phosphoglycolate phosphatase-like HAD superfamily hydrolase